MDEQKPSFAKKDKIKPEIKLRVADNSENSENREDARDEKRPRQHPSLVDTLKQTSSRILPAKDAPARTLLPRRLAAHVIDALILAAFCTLFYLVLGLSEDLESKRSLAAVLAYLSGLPGDFASGFLSIDALIASILAVFLLSLINASLPGSVAIMAFLALLLSPGDVSDNLSPSHYLLVQIVYLTAPVLYNVLFEKLSGTTPGKHLLGLKLKSFSEADFAHEDNAQDSVKDNPGWLNIFGREILRLLYIDFVLPWWYPLSFALKWKRSERMLYDRLAGTGVVSESKEKPKEESKAELEELSARSSKYERRAALILFSLSAVFFALVYIGLLQEPLHLVGKKITLKVLKYSNPAQYGEYLVSSLVYHDRAYYQAGAGRLEDDILALRRVLSVAKARKLEATKYRKIYLQLALLNEELSLQPIDKGLAYKAQLESIKCFEHYIDICEQTGLPLAKDTQSLAKDWHIDNILYQLGELYLRVDRPGDAVKVLRQALESSGLGRERPFVYYALVRAYEALSDQEGAINALDELSGLYIAELETAYARGDDAKVQTVFTDFFQTRLKQIKALKNASRKQEAEKILKSTKLVMHKYADAHLEENQELDELR
ncbi:MAG: RDD family protein [Candidatus Obscuribacterales bacterium]|nr:RDD family protein [Candidatus Obscuribacterales bacterium]